MGEKKYRQARNDAGIKPERAAVQLGVSLHTLYNWERGDTKPDANNIRDMARLYGVSADYLLGIV